MIHRILLIAMLAGLLAALALNATVVVLLLSHHELVTAPAPRVSPPTTLGGAYNPAPPPLGASPRQQAKDLYLARLHSQWAIDYYAQRWGQSAYWMTRLASCESGITPWAWNPSGASGLFQFLPTTYWYYANQIGERRTYWNAWGASNVAGYMWHLGKQQQWSCIWLIGYYGGVRWTLPPIHPPVPGGAARR